MGLASRPWSLHAADKAQVSGPCHAARHFSSWGTALWASPPLRGFLEEGAPELGSGQGVGIASRGPLSKKRLNAGQCLHAQPLTCLGGHCVPWEGPTQPQGHLGQAGTGRICARPDVPTVLPLPSGSAPYTPGAGSPARSMISLLSPSAGRAAAVPHPTGDVT